VVDLARRYYEQDDDSVLPRSIASFKAFENAMTLDIAMGGSTNTVLHLLAAAHEAEVDFTMADIDRLSRRVPVLCKVAPAVADVHMEDVHRAGGIMAILGELDRAGLHRTSTCRPFTRRPWARRWSAGTSCAPTTGRRTTFFRAAPGGVPTQVAFSQNRRCEDARHSTAPSGVIRDAEHAFSKDGGLAVLYGNLAPDGCIVKTAGVDDEHPGIRRPARGCSRARTPRSSAHPERRQVKAGDVVVIRYEGPRGGPGMQEMLYPTSYLKSKGLGRPAPSSPTGASPAARRASPSATSRRKRRRAA
jgi:dihydroxy-acid dehydratase